MPSHSLWRITTATAVCGLLALGATNIDPTLKFAWDENTGWLNWHDADAGVQGVRLLPTILSGYAWAENVGFLNLGSGHPASGTAYANADSSDFGVNIDPATGNLFGLAWGENIGWINFDTRASLGPFGQQARFDFPANRFRGYAWSENTGWINLDDATSFVAVVPPVCHTPFADADGDGDVDEDDFAFLQRCFTGPEEVLPEGCECFNRPQPGFPHGDLTIDSSDLQAFEACISGPSVPANPACAN